MQTFQEQIEEEVNRVEKEKQEAFDKKGLKTFWAPSKGENLVEILPVPIKESKFENTLKKVFRVNVKGKEFDWSLNPKNPIYRDIIREMKAGTMIFNVLKTGDGPSTRYELLKK